MSEINCNKCAICDFKESLCKRCDKMKRIGSADDIEKLIIECSPSVQLDVPDKNVGDTISRQGAIDELKKIPDLTVYAYCSFLDMLMNMPSAQPEITGKQVAEYCRKRNLVLITHESFETLKAYYDRQNSV